MTGAIWAIALLGATLAAVMALYFARRAGADSVKAKLGEQNEKAAKRIADAVADVPSDDDVLSRELRDGTRKL